MQHGTHFVVERERRYRSTTSIRARVSNGRLIVDEPTELPEGTTLDLVVDGDDDDLDADERATLIKHLAKSARAVAAGCVRPAEDLLAELRDRR